MADDHIKKDALNAYAFLRAYYCSITNFMVYFYRHEYVKAINDEIRSQEGKKLPYNQMLDEEVYFDMATIVWCRIFGSDNTNATHWKNIRQNRCLKIACRSIGLRSNKHIKKHFIKKADIREDDFKNLWNSVTSYRNKYVAHHDLAECFNTNLDNIMNVSLRITMKPDLELAKNIMLAFYDFAYQLSLFLARQGLLLHHYPPQRIFDEVIADLAGNMGHSRDSM